MISRAPIDEEKTADGPKGIFPSDQERKNGAYSLETVGKILSALHQDGLVVLKDIIDVDHIDAINEAMCSEVDGILADPTKYFNHGLKSNFLQRPPVTNPDLLYEDVYFNPFLHQIANSYLGSKPILNWLTSNNALANTGGMRQPVHKDNGYLHPQFPFYFIANIPLVDFSVENGSTEFWLGSHAHTDENDQRKSETEADRKTYPYSAPNDPIPPVKEDVLEARRQVRPPIQPTCQKGDIMIRDLRTWHAGMPNNSSEHRIMLALGYMSPSYPNHVQRCHLPASQSRFFLENSQGKIELRADFYSDEEYPNVKRDTQFTTRPSYL